MTGTRRFFLIPLLLLAGQLIAQQLFLSRFQPGYYLADNRHQVELRQNGPDPLDIGGYYLMTRDYALRFSPKTYIPAGAPLRIARQKSDAYPAEIQLNGLPDFLIRFNLLESDSNYAVLFDPRLRIMDAFYFSPQPNVPFLPVRDTFITMRGQLVPYNLPPENRDIWQHLSARDDPANYIFRRSCRWSTLDTAASVFDHQDLSLRYYDGIVSIKWSTGFERSTESHTIERSLDQEIFVTIGEIEAQGDSEEFTYYSWYDSEVEQGKTYFYRIQTTIAGNEPVYSRLLSVQPEEGIEEFELEVILLPHSDGT